jgi:diguanylate cyclase (GGDEF)-like protein
LDLRTLFILTVLVNIVIALVMAIYWRTQKTYAGFGYWTLTNVAMTVTFSLFALKGIAPEFLTVVVANTMAVAGAACRYAGVRFFWGAETLPHLHYHQLLVSGCAVFLAYFTFIDDDIVLRLFVVSLIISGYFLATACSMLQGVRQGYRYESRTLALLNLIYAVLMLGRAAEWYLVPQARHLLIASSLSTLYFSSILLLEVTTALLFLMLNSQRLAKSLMNVQAELEKLAASDMLTGLYNRRKLEELCSQEVAAARERTRFSSMLLIDLDFLKQVNDTFGHPAGDALINSVVKIIRSQLRDTDILGRLGGDEFIEILPSTSHESATLIAEQIREAVWEQPFLWEEHKIRMSVSIGVASLNEDDTNWLDWMKRADNNLYLAKSSGRNKVV